MKSFAKYFGVVAGMAALLVSCNKPENITMPETDTVEMTIIAGSDETKTVLGADGAVTWSATGEYLQVLEKNGSTNLSSYTSDEGKPADEGRTMSFAVSLDSKTAESFDYYALYPSTSFVSDKYSNAKKVKVSLAAEQCPTATSFDPTADILVSKPVMGQGSQPTNLSLQFARIVAVGKMTIKNLNTTEKVQKVSFTATDKVVNGRSYINLEDASAVEYGYYGASATVTMDYSAQSINANGMTAYFTCWPFEIAGGGKFTVVVETENYTFTRDVTIPEGKPLAFNAGRATGFNVSFSGIEGVEKVHPTVYTLVEEASKIADGAEYLIVTGTTAIGSYNTSKSIYNGVTVTVNNKTISITSEAVNVITLEAGDSENQFYLIDSDNKYIQYNSGSENEVYRGDKTADDTYDLWTVTATKITNVGNSNRRLQKNNTSARFACYAGTQTDVTLYVNESTLAPTLSVPKNLIADAESSTVTVVWDAVENAESYDVTCAGQKKNVTGKEATFTDVAVGTYEVSVVAKGTGFKNSKAAVTSVIVGKPTLDKPVIKTVSETANGFYAELEAAVQYAESYAWDLYEGSVADDNLVGTGTNATEKFSITINETDFFITEFAPETTYYLVITAMAAAYTSSESEPVSFITAAEANDGSLEKPFTAAEAITAIDAGRDLTNKYVKGVITEVTEFNSTYGSITYNIESGEKTLMVYSGLDLGKAQFSSKSDLKINDEVLVCGTLKKYNSTYEFDKNNYLVTLNGSSEVYVGLKVSGQTTTFNVGDEFVFGGTVVQDWRGKDDVNVTSSASFSGYDMNTAGTQTVIVSVGEETASYKITVMPAGLKTVTLQYTTTTTTNMTGNNDAATVGLNADEWSVVGSKGGGTNYPGLNKSKYIAIYYNATESASITVSSSKHTIHSIKITYTGTSYNKGKVLVNVNEVTGTDGTYSINSNSFVVTNGNTSSAQVRISSIEITYN